MLCVLTESDAVDGEEEHCGGGGSQDHDGGGGSEDCGGAPSLGHFSASEESSDDSQTPESSLHPGSQDGSPPTPVVVGLHEMGYI